MTGRTARWLLIVSLFAATTVAFTWPLVRAPASTYLLVGDSRPQELRDPQLTSWILAWVNHALRTDPRHLFDANVFHPVPNALAFSEHLVGGALQVLPVDLAFADPVLDHNALVLLSFLVAGVGMTLLLRELGASHVAAVASGLLFAFGPWRLHYLMHVHMLAAHLMPLTLLFAHRALRRARWTDAIACGACFWLQAATSVYHAYFFGVALAGLLTVHLAVRLPRAPRALPRLAVALLGALGALVPLFLPYLEVRERYGMERAAEQMGFFSARGVHYLAPLLKPWPHWQARAVSADAASMALLGLGTWLLLALAWLRPRRRLTLLYAAVAMAMVLLSLGPRMSMRFGTPAVPGPYGWLADWVPGWAALRAPVRASIPAILALTVLAGLGADALLARVRSRRGRALLVGALALLVVAECWPPRLRAVPATRSARAPGLYEWLREHAFGEPLLELPFGSWETRSEYMVHSHRHWGRLATGYSGWYPGEAWVRRTALRLPAADAIDALHDLGVRRVLVHADAGETPDLCRPGGSPRLRLVQRDADGCIVETRAGARAHPAPGRRLPRTALRVSGPDGEPLPVLADGDVATHWRERLAAPASSVRIDLARLVQPTRLVLRLGRHFGEYPAVLRVETSVDGEQWRTVRATDLVPAPLAQMRERPDDLSVSLALDPAPARAVRIVRPAFQETQHLLIPRHGHWGAHEIELYVQ